MPRLKSINYVKKEDGSRELHSKEYETTTSDFMAGHTKTLVKNENRPIGKYVDANELSTRIKTHLQTLSTSDPDSVNFRTKKK
jgi:hypothetical protein